MKKNKQSPTRSKSARHNGRADNDTNRRPNPWDAAKKIKVFRCAPGYLLADLEPGVKFFVLMLEQLGAETHYSCEGHPKGFYVMFTAPYEFALRVSACGYFTVEICRHVLWTMRLSERQRVHSQRRKAQLLRRAAVDWEDQLGKLNLSKRPAI